jgi:hypothetical protein
VHLLLSVLVQRRSPFSPLPATAAKRLPTPLCLCSKHRALATAYHARAPLSHAKPVAKPPLLEKRFIVTPAIHFWYGLITVADTKNEFLFFVSADLINRYKKYYFSYRLT